MVEDLCESVQRASNLLVLDGVVDKSNSGRVIGVLTNAVQLLSDTQMCPGAVLATGIQVWPQSPFSSHSRHAVACDWLRNTWLQCLAPLEPLRSAK
jgi:hypothetical protein